MNFIEIALKATMVLCCAALAATLLRRRSAAARHLIWAVGLLATLLLPFASVTMPAVPVHALEPVAFSLTVYANEPVHQSNVNVLELLWWIWMGGALAFASRLAFGTLGLAIQSRSAMPFQIENSTSREMGIRRPVVCKLSHAVHVPMTWGVLRPIILLPSDARHWTASRLSVVLAHELGHVKRFDWFTQFIAHAACALYWFHPLAWYAERQLRRERELACDDAVLAHGVLGTDYAGHLVDIVRGLQTRNDTFSVGVAMAQQSNLEMRIRAMLNPRIRRGLLTRRLFAVATVALAGILLPLASLRAPAQGAAGAISGSVYDPSGAAVASARITLINLDGRNTEVTRTNDAGAYQLSGLPPGRYDLHVAAPGFALFKQSGVAITGGGAVVQNVSLSLGKITENIDVVGQGTPVKVASSHPGAPTRLKMGGNVQATRLTHMIRPSYPASAKARGVEGVVLLRAIIGRDGHVLNLETLNTQVDEELIKAATDAVSQWRYEPTLLNGEPVEIVTEVTVNFTLAK